MVERAYLLHRPVPPSRAKQVFDQRVMPVGIDVAARTEAALEAWSRRARAAPLRAVLAALGVGYLLAVGGRVRR